MKLPKRKVNRLAEYDYRTPNAYFVTICTAGRKNLFWKDTIVPVNAESVPLTHLGKTVQLRIAEIPMHYPAVSVDHFAVMPNHIHLLLQICANLDGRPMTAPTISTIVNQLKGAVSKGAGFSVWQKGFHDHIVRGEQDYLAIWSYIEENPHRWDEDELVAR